LTSYYFAMASLTIRAACPAAGSSQATVGVQHIEILGFRWQSDKSALDQRRYIMLGWPINRSTAWLRTSPTRLTPRFLLKTSRSVPTQDACINAPQIPRGRGGPPPPSPVHAENTDSHIRVHQTRYVLHGRNARPIVSIDHHAVHRRSTSGNTTP